MEAPMNVNVVKNATCTFCGCVCDDIELHAEGDRIVKARNACSLGDAWFKNHTAEHLYPDALVDGNRPSSTLACLQSQSINRRMQRAGLDGPVGASAGKINDTPKTIWPPAPQEAIWSKVCPDLCLAEDGWRQSICGGFFFFTRTRLGIGLQDLRDRLTE